MCWYPSSTQHISERGPLHIGQPRRLFVAKPFIQPFLCAFQFSPVRSTEQFLRRTTATKIATPTRTLPFSVVRCLQRTACNRFNNYRASLLMHAMSAWSVKTRHAPSRHCREARVYGHTTMAMHAMSTPPPPLPRSQGPPACTTSLPNAIGALDTPFEPNAVFSMFIGFASMVFFSLSFP